MPSLPERVLRNLRWFERLWSFPEVALPGMDDLGGLISRTDHLFLGYYTEEMVTERLEYFGVLPKLRQKGYLNLRVSLDTKDPEHQYLRVYADPGERLLAEAIYHEGEFRTRAPFASLLHGHRFHMLFIQWMLLQKPDAEFTPERPQLPGQRHPGLRVAKEVVTTLTALVEKQNFDGMLVSPEFAHNAIMYMRAFQYVDPYSQGKLLALKRDLAEVSLADSSWGIELGCVRERDTDEVFQWFHDEMCYPRRRRLIAYFGSDAYQKRVAHTLEKTHFVFDRALFEERFPQREEFFMRPTVPPELDEEQHKL